MASEDIVSEPTETPALVCAPCWICLEDGPDEKGEPLVRECSCRGETSAGYHLSCLIDYATKRTGDAIGIMENAEEKELPNYIKPWLSCPNCSQTYKESVRLPLAHAFVAATGTLSETNVVRFQARTCRITALINCYRVPKGTSRSTDLALAENEIVDLLEVVNEKAGDLARSMVNDPTPETMERNRVKQSSRLFTYMGDIRRLTGDKENALKMFERALDYYDRFAVNEVRGIKEHIIRNIEQLKKEMGLIQITVDEEVKLRRGQLKDAIEGNASAKSVVCAKYSLALALCETVPPQFLEAIQLTNAAFGTSRQVFGPDNDLTLHLKSNLDAMKKGYREFLQGIQAGFW